MHKLNSLKDSSFNNHDSNVENQEINPCDNKDEKVLCNHCGRTSSNGIRCLGMCVADHDY